MSQAGIFNSSVTPPPGTAVQTIEGNSGGPISPNGFNNIFVVGDGVTVDVTGNGGTNTLTISTIGAEAHEYDTDNGNAAPLGGIINIKAYNAINNSGSSVTFSAPGSSNTVQLNVTDTNNNTIVGNGSGNGTISGNRNTVLGHTSGISLGFGSRNTLIGASVAPNLSVGDDNVVIGDGAANSLNGGSFNVIIGKNSSGALDTGEDNVIIGGNSASSVNGNQNVLIGFSVAGALGGSNNVIIGQSAASTIAGGNYNVMIGDNTGDSYDGSDSSNICIGYNVAGVSGEAHTLRIGKSTGTNDGYLNQAFICGIDGVDVGSVATVVTEFGDQLGTAVITAGTGIDITPGANTITISASSAVSESFVTDSGTAIPSGGVINIITDNTGLNAGATVLFAGSGNTVQLNVTDVNSNTTIGKDAGSSILSGNQNTMLGALAGNGLSLGSSNILIGYNSGDNYIGSESSNILLGNTGTASESHVLRIGAGTGSGTGQLNKAFISGINGINVGSTATVVTESGDQLGTAVITAGTGITITPGANAITISSSGLTNLAYTNVNSSPYVVLVTDDYLSVDSSGGAITVQLPNAATLSRTFIIKDRTGSAATHNITVTTVGGAVNIDGATTFIMNTAYQAVSVIGNGSTYELY